MEFDRNRLQRKEVKTVFKELKKRIRSLLSDTKAEMILPKNVLKEFAVFLSGEIKDFYLSEEGKEYYREWLKREEDKEGKKKI